MDNIKLTQIGEPVKTLIERVYRGMVFSSKDWGSNSFDWALYGIVAGWDGEWEEWADDRDIREWGITQSDFECLRELHNAFIGVYNKYNP